MMLLGADMHKRSHTVAALEVPSGEVLEDLTVSVGACGFAEVLDWASSLDDERVWALEDCRHVSGSFERFLVASGERVVRVPAQRTAAERRGGRQRGKSDLIDAVAIARAALREGIDRLAVAEPAGIELDIKLLVDHRERLIGQRTALNNDLLWHLHDLWPQETYPKAAMIRTKLSDTIARRLARIEQTARVRVARHELRLIRELTRTIIELQTAIAELVEQTAPQLLAEPGFGPLTTGKLIGEIAGIHRFPNDAKLARAGGLAPIPVHSGRTDRHRLDRGGNRQLNAAIHRIALTRARCHPETIAYMSRKREEGKTYKDALRCLKRHLARRIWHLLQTPKPTHSQQLQPSIS